MALYLLHLPSVPAHSAQRRRRHRCRCPRGESSVWAGEPQKWEPRSGAGSAAASAAQAGRPGQGAGL